MLSPFAQFVVLKLMSKVLDVPTLPTHAISWVVGVALEFFKTAYACTFAVADDTVADAIKPNAADPPAAAVGMAPVAAVVHGRPAPVRTLLADGSALADVGVVA